MATLVHILIFLVSVGIIWFFAGMLVDAVGRIAKRSCGSGFFTAFFVLGFLTSISEVSVAINAGVSSVPGVSVGNLVGASLVLLLFVVPLLAVAGRGIRINEGVPRGVLLIVLFTTALPALLVIDGNVTRTEGLLALLMYATVGYALFKNRMPIATCDLPEEPPLARVRSIAAETGRIAIGAIAIFAAAHFLVEQAVYFAQLLSVPASLVGLLLLSLGTNIPEIVIALRAVMARKTDIAFGDYLGSAAMNTCIFALLAMGVGTFALEPSEFVMTAALFVFGIALLYAFARSQRTITRAEGAALLVLYGAFVAMQFFNIARFAGD